MRRLFSYRKKFFIIPVILLFGIFATGALAQTITQTQKSGINVTLSPVFMNLAVKAGMTKKSSFKVTNNNNFVETYDIAVIKYKPDNKGSIIHAEITKEKDTTLDWFKFSTNRIVVQPKSTQKVDFEISPSPDAFLGYYFGITLQRSKEDYAQIGTTKIVGAPTIPILLEVTRSVGKDVIGLDAEITKYKSGSLVDFRTTSPWYEELPVQFEVTFKNTGKIHLVPFGEIFISQGKNSEIATIPINESGGNTLPGSQRKYSSIWNDGFIVKEPVKENGQYKKDDKGNMVYQTQIYWDKLTKFRVGRYTAHAVLAYNNGQYDVPLESSVSFWIIPWKIIVVVATLIALVLFGLRNLVVGLLRS